MATAGELRLAIEAHGVPLATPAELDARNAWPRVRMAAVWKQPPGLLDRCGAGLRLVLSLGAGVDFLLGSPAVVGPDGAEVVPATPCLLPPGARGEEQQEEEEGGAEREEEGEGAGGGGGGCGGAAAAARPEPAGLPPLVARIVDPHMASRMAAWVAWGVLTWQRRMLDYARAQRQGHWAGAAIERGHNRDARDVRVAVLGFGLMGRAAAGLLAGMGYRVSAWARRGGRGDGARAEGQLRNVRVCGPPPEDGGGGGGGEEAAGGRAALRAFCEGQDVLVVLLPLTRATVRVVDSELLARMRPGGCLINGARGAHVDAAAVLAALGPPPDGEKGHGVGDGGVGGVTEGSGGRDEGAPRLDMALLDVFDREPLPPDSPLWRHPHVVITPHSAAFTEVSAAAEQVGNAWRAVVGGERVGVGSGGEPAGGERVAGSGGDCAAAAATLAERSALARALGANLVDQQAGY